MSVIAALVMASVGLLGVLYGVYRWWRGQILREALIDSLLHAETGVMARLDSHGEQLVQLRRAISPNGLNTNEIGDIAKRTEHAVAQVRRSLDRHIGESDEVHRGFREAIEQLRRER